MDIGTSYGLDGILNLQSAELDSGRKYSRIQDSTTPSGDTVSISDDAKKLYSEMIHKYDHAGSANSDAVSAEKASQEEGAQGAGQGGGGGESSSGNSVEQIKKQIQSLKSQMSALSSQMGSGQDAGVMGKINALQAQIAALEAQLAEAESA